MHPKRVLLKVSGEALAGEAGHGLDFGLIRSLLKECLAVIRDGIQMGMVVGGGNFLRGGQLPPNDVDRVTGDQMGMLATVINGLALRAAAEALQGKATVMTARTLECGVELFDRRLCLERLAQGHLVIFAGGTGNPFFTTDTAAALRASEIGADLFLKATKVDGVYDDDPVKNPGAKRYDSLSYMDILKGRLGVMDATAVTLCMENGIPIKVFKLLQEGALKGILSGEPLGTTIT